MRDSFASPAYVSALRVLAVGILLGNILHVVLKNSVRVGSTLPLFNPKFENSCV